MKTLLGAAAGFALITLAALAPGSGAMANNSNVIVRGDGRGAILYNQCVLTNWGGFGDPDTLDQAMPGCKTLEQAHIEFDIKAKLNGQGKASGHVRFKLTNPFEKDSWWTAPENATAKYSRINGEVMSITTRADGATVVSGQAEFLEFDKDGKVFFCASDYDPCVPGKPANEPRVPFEIVTGGSLPKGTMTLNWCLYPGPFEVKYQHGDLKVKPGASNGQVAGSTEALVSQCGR